MSEGRARWPTATGRPGGQQPMQSSRRSIAPRTATGGFRWCEAERWEYGPVEPDAEVETRIVDTLTHADPSGLSYVARPVAAQRRR